MVTARQPTTTGIRPKSNESPTLSETEPSRPDPHVTRSRNLLHTTLLDLVQRRRWEQITVQDIIDTAQVSRSTFYAHFDNKLDVLTSGIDDVLATLNMGAPGHPPELLALFEHCDEMAELFRALLHQPVLGEILDRFHRACVAAWTEHLDHDSEPIRAEFLAGATVAVLRYYVSTRTRATPNEAAAKFATMINPILELT